MAEKIPYCEILKKNDLGLYYSLLNFNDHMKVQSNKNRAVTTFNHHRSLRDMSVDDLQILALLMITSWFGGVPNLNSSNFSWTNLKKYVNNPK